MTKLSLRTNKPILICKKLQSMHVFQESLCQCQGLDQVAGEHAQKGAKYCAEIDACDPDVSPKLNVHFKICSCNVLNWHSSSVSGDPCSIAKIAGNGLWAAGNNNQVSFVIVANGCDWPVIA